MPVDGTIVGIDKVIIADKHAGRTIDIQPTLAPSDVVTVSNIAADPSLTVGSMVTAGSSRLGGYRSRACRNRSSPATRTTQATTVLVEVHQPPRGEAG